jgi:hypothetical protein
MTYTISCIAQNSRPSVSLKIIDGINNKPLDEFPSAYGVYRSTQCDTSSFCTTFYGFSVTINSTNFLSLTSLVCKAENLTEPYSISSQIKVGVSIRQRELPLKIYFLK